MFAEWVKTKFNLSFRESWAVDKIVSAWKSIFSSGFSFKRLAASLMVIAEMFCFLFFQTPTTPRGQELDLTGYQSVFFDDFNGDSLNTDVWQYRSSGPRRNGFNAQSQVEVKDGNLVMTAEYLENGEFGAGWYAGMINLKQNYTRGYFEIKCICNKGKGFWSAFWLQAPSPYDPEISRGGIGGAEIDIFEAMSAGERTSLRRNAVTQTIHCAGKTGDTSGKINSCQLGTFRGKDIYNQYNTYGVEWTEDEYIFYINGIETSRSSFADGVSTVPEQVIVSLEIPDECNFDKGFKTQYFVDSVSIYQKAG